ncbi:zf-CCHC domain-containing protein, partial [Tanacetum coccineum]
MVSLRKEKNSYPFWSSRELCIGAVFLGVRATFMDTAYVDSMDTPYWEQPSNIFVLAPNYVPFSLSSQNTLELLHLSTLKQLMRQPQNDKKTSQRSRDDKNGKSDRKCFRCGDPNHLIGECPKPQRDKNQRAFVGSSWSDSGEEDDENIKDETFLVAQASNE